MDKKLIQQLTEYGQNLSAGGVNEIAIANVIALVITELQQKPVPEAYMGYALYDSDSTLYEQGKVILSKKARNKHEELIKKIAVPKDGYIETYLVNETSDDVWFDQFRILSTGPLIVQETHFDPWGVELSGLGYQYGGIKVNPYLYNGKEANGHLGVNIYDFGARMYDPAIGRWFVVDPLADQMRRHSPYNYAFDNPIRFIDPDGMAPIDYYNESGKRLGTDGNNDGRLVVVVDKKEARQISATDKAEGTTSLSQVNSGVELPNFSVRSEMGKAVSRSLQPTNASMSGEAGFIADTKGGAHEEGGIFGKNSDGTYVVNHAEPGSAVTLDDNKAMVNVFSGDNGTIVDVEGTFHTHPAINSAPGANSIGGASRGFGQSPSPDDFNAASTNSGSGAVIGNNYVLGTGPASSGGQRVSIYNGVKVLATFPLSKFINIK